MFESCAVFKGSHHVYCWLDNHALYKTPLILTPNLSVNCSAIQMFDTCDGLQSLNQQWRSSCVFCGLRAARFTRTPKPKSQPAFAHPCLRAVWLTRVLNLYEEKGVLSVAWGTRGLKHKIRRLKNVHRLRVVRFTRALKPIMRPTHIAPCLRAVRFTMVLKLPSSLRCKCSCLRVVLFTRGLKHIGTAHVEPMV